MNEPLMLSRMEWTIMNAIWKFCQSSSDATVSELMPFLKDKKWNVSTVKTMLERLVKKGALSNVLRGHTSFYKPIVSKSETVRQNIADLFDNVLEGAFGPLVAYLADTKGLDDKQRAQLEKMLRDSQKE